MTLKKINLNLWYSLSQKDLKKFGNSNKKKLLTFFEKTCMIFLKEKNKMSKYAVCLKIEENGQIREQVTEFKKLKDAYMSVIDTQNVQSFKI